MLSFDEEARVETTVNQEIDSIEELQHVHDAKVATNCKVVQRPWGAYGESSSADPNVSISTRAEENPKLVVYFVKHQD